MILVAQCAHSIHEFDISDLIIAVFGELTDKLADGIIGVRRPCPSCDRLENLL